MCLLAVVAAGAQQARKYSFAASQGTYSEITGGTVIYKYALTEDFENWKATENQNQGEVTFWGNNVWTKKDSADAGMPIGFNFKFAGADVDQFVAGGLYLALGKDKVSIDPSKAGETFFLDNKSLAGLHSNGNLYAQDGTEISYKTEGEAPNRVLVVQYKGLTFRDWSGNISTENANFQIRLYETTNNIELCFSGWGMANGASLSVFLFNALRGTDENDVLSTSTSWSEPEILRGVNLGNVKLNNIRYSSTSFPADGLTYRFSYPTPCAEPASQPTDLRFDAAATDRITGSFHPTADAEYYLTILSETETLSVQPDNGTYYKINDRIGDAIVVEYKADTTFSTMNPLSSREVVAIPDTIELKTATKYYVHILSVNDNCADGPVYRTATPLVGSITTMPAAPAELDITKEGSTAVTLKATANAAGNKIIIAKTLLPGEDDNRNLIIDGKFGQPTAGMKVGDKIADADTIVYIGTATELEVKNLPANRLVHFKAWSVDDAGNVSTTGTTDNILTWGEVPFVASMEGQPNEIFGWDTEGFGMSRTDLLYSRVEQKAEGVNNYFQTQWINLPEGENRIILDYNMVSITGFGAGTKSPYEWKEKDSLLVLVTADGTKYDTLHISTAADHLQQPTADFYPRLLVPFTQYAGQKVKVKVVWNCFGKMDISIRNLEVEQRLACDYPTDVEVSGIEMDKATVAWKSQGSETLWDIRYRVASAEEWTVINSVSENPVTLDGIPTNSAIELQVRALCSASETSLWSKSATFTSGYGLPFTETFGTEPTTAWTFARGFLKNEGVEFCSDCTPAWKYGTLGRMKAVHTSPNNQAAATDSIYDWFIFPMVDFGNGSYNYQLELDLYLMMAAEGSNETYYIVYSDADGNFTRNNIIDTIKHSELPTKGQLSYNISLKGVKGHSRVAIYTESLANPKLANILATRVAIQPTCPNDAVVTVDKITTNSAVARWKGTKEDSQEWIVAYGAEGGEMTRLSTKYDTLLLSGLTQRTTYTVAVTKACAVGDTAKSAVATFTTLTDVVCEPVSDAKVSDVTKNAASISWTADAYGYNVRYRAKGADDWTVRNTSDNSIGLVNLMPETVYEYGVQAICSPAEGDMSEYTATAEFTTQAITCFVPTEIAAAPTHKSIDLTWKTTADSVEINWRKAETTEWTVVVIKDAATHTIADLEPETAFDIRIRALCSETDMSDWSGIIKTTTLAIPECVVPSDLKADKVDATSIQTSWTADASNLSWSFRYRSGDATEYTTVENLSEKNYLIKDLKPATLYLWGVRATCDEERQSAWAANQRTTTASETAVDLVSADRLTVYTSDNVLNIINSVALYINSVALYTIDGTLISEHQVNDNQNIIVPTTLSHTVAIVRIATPATTLTYKVIFD